jgi:molecular chaperone GrpE (heat shock protein)
MNQTESPLMQAFYASLDEQIAQHDSENERFKNRFNREMEVQDKQAWEKLFAQMLS